MGILPTAGQRLSKPSGQELPRTRKRLRSRGEPCGKKRKAQPDLFCPHSGRRSQHPGRGHQVHPEREKCPQGEPGATHMDYLLDLSVRNRALCLISCASPATPPREHPRPGRSRPRGPRHLRQFPAGEGLAWASASRWAMVEVAAAVAARASPSESG